VPVELRSLSSSYPSASCTVLGRLAGKAAADSTVRIQGNSGGCIPALHVGSSNTKAAALGDDLAESAGSDVVMMTVRVLAHELDGDMTSVRMELSSEASLFFHYCATITPDSYQHMAVRCQHCWKRSCAACTPPVYSAVAAGSCA
jgi:hypothetical protein